jgi:hypothetical protein
MAWIIVINSLHVRGMALFPFILLKERRLKQDEVIMNHERIHHRQQIELLIAPFYFFYLLHYAWNLMQYRNHRRAYQNIVFEKEAFANDHNLQYLDRRKPFAFLKHF